jgi:hypothetical protein
MDSVKMTESGTVEIPIADSNSKTQSSLPDICDDQEKGIVEGYSESYVVDKALERKLLFKIDMHVLPTLALMYLFW